MAEIQNKNVKVLQVITIIIIIFQIKSISKLQSMPAVRTLPIATN